jgi:hypothetical protein
MEIEPEVIDPLGGSHLPPAIPKWKLLLGAVAGLMLLVGIAMVAFWLALIITGLLLVSWLVRRLIQFITGRRSDATVQIVFRNNRMDG